MLKEIDEQPAAVADTLLGHFVDGRIVLDEQRLSDQELREIDKVFVVACGTAYHSGLLAKYAIEHWTRLPVEVELASEFRYRDPVLDRTTLVVAISQSGETADTLEAVRHAKEQKARVLAICNTNGAQIPRESDAVLYTRAGPGDRRRLHQDVPRPDHRELPGRAGAGAGPRHQVPRRGGARIPRAGGDAGPGRAGAGPRRAGRELARRFADVADGAVPRPPRRLPGGAGRRAQAQGAGVHARRGLRRRRAQARPDRVDRGRPAGDRRDAVAEGPRRCCTPSCCPTSARSRPAARAPSSSPRRATTPCGPYADHLIEIPAVPTLFQPLLSTIPLQVFAAEVAQARGYDVDKPRNLAKSVTVE